MVAVSFERGTLVVDLVCWIFCDICVVWQVQFYLRILAYLVMYDSGKVSLEHLLLSWYPSQRGLTSVP